ncbi:partial D-inositol 3-phosphate glycosyltransferase, partial [Anaerolineae bacterium]
MHVGLVTLTDTDTALDLANALSEAGELVSLYLSEKACLELNETPAGYRSNLYDKGVIPLSCQVNIYRFPRMRDPRSIKVVIEICQQMYRDQVDLVHILAGPAEPWLAVLACLIRSIPVVTTLIVPVANVGDPLSIWVELINRLLISGSNLVIVNGQNQIIPVQSQYKIPDHRIVHIPLGARTSSAKWISGEVQEQPQTILFFGRLAFYKGLEFLIRAQPLIAQQVPEARILIAGFGDELARCRTMISDESAFEIHEGVVASELMANFFARASLVVLPYISASTSGVLLTAYEFGKPVIATNVGSLPEYVVEGFTGLLI